MGNEKIEPWQADCVTNEIYLALVALAKEKGWEGSAIGCKTSTLSWISKLDDGSIVGNSVRQRDRDDIALERAIYLLKAGPPEPPIKVYGTDDDDAEYEYAVEFPGDGVVKVGCMVVPKVTVERIAEKLGYRIAEKLDHMM